MAAVMDCFFATVLLILRVEQLAGPRTFLQKSDFSAILLDLEVLRSSLHLDWGKWTGHMSLIDSLCAFKFHLEITFDRSSTRLSYSLRIEYME